ncbi:uncharacterized protein [Penaeus vannamei]|uniref:uncharacterized protein isoform X2 n=1 Tax=Penaeus vannamei TaxID=6689 RepID=UPI00387F3902
MQVDKETATFSLPPGVSGQVRSRPGGGGRPEATAAEREDAEGESRLREPFEKQLHRPASFPCPCFCFCFVGQGSLAHCSTWLEESTSHRQECVLNCSRTFRWMEQQSQNWLRRVCRLEIWRGNGRQNKPGRFGFMTSANPLHKEIVDHP